MNLRVKLSLKVKIFLAAALFYFAALGTLTYLTVRSERALLLAEMGERAKVGISLMELSVTGALYKLDTFRLETIAREAKALPPSSTLISSTTRAGLLAIIIRTRDSYFQVLQRTREENSKIQRFHADRDRS